MDGCCLHEPVSTDRISPFPAAESVSPLSVAFIRSSRFECKLLDIRVPDSVEAAIGSRRGCLSVLSVWWLSAIEYV
jgi:hypothetical protein